MRIIYLICTWRRLWMLCVASALLFGLVGYYQNAYILPDAYASGFPLGKVRYYQASSPEHRFDTLSAYVINMDQSKDRWKHMQSQLQTLGMRYARVSAVNGRVLSSDQRSWILDEAAFQRYRGRAPFPGELGCSLSHYRALKAFLKSNHSFALILEDDVQFDSKKLGDLLEELITQHANRWDLVTLQHSHRGLPKRVAALRSGELVRYGLHVAEAGGYVINRVAAERLLARFFPLKVQYDYYFTRDWELGFRFLGVDPVPMRQHLFLSLISHSHKEMSGVAHGHEDAYRKGTWRWRKWLFLWMTDVARWLRR